MKEKKERRIQDNILFLGNRNDVYRLYQAMDVFVFPSHYEGLGMVVVEAQTAGLPCVVSDVVPSEAKILAGTEMLNLEKPEEWAEQILEMARLPKKDTTEVIQRAGFNIVCEKEKLQQFYESIIIQSEVLNYT